MSTAPASTGTESHFVRIESEAVGPTQSGQLFFILGGQYRRSAVGPVHVEPDLVFGADIGYLVQWIDRTGIYRAGAGHYRSRDLSAFPIFTNGGIEG